VHPRKQRSAARVRIISDNPLYKPYEGNGDEINIIGRIRWFAREM
jgi:phage repressor protein C with HTH and peptisase S24 domain